MIKRAVSRIILLLFASLLAITYFFQFTHLGAITAIHLIPGKTSYQSLSGNLLNGLQIKALKHNNQEKHLSIQKALVQLKLNRHFKLSLITSWQQLTFTVNQSTLGNSPQGTFRAQGLPNHYLYQMAFSLINPTLKTMVLLGQGEGDTHHLDLQNNTLYVSQGTMTLTGRYQWTPKISWDIKAKGNKLQPHAAHIDAVIDFALTSQGQLTPSLEITNRITKLSGSINNIPLDGHSTLHIAHNTLHVRNTQLNLGAASLTLSGHVSDTYQLQWHLDLPQTSEFYASMQGQLSSHGSLSGKRNKPVLKNNINLRNFSWKNTSIQSLQINQHSMLTASGKLQSSFNIEKLESPRFKINTFKLSANGTWAKQIIQLSLKTEDGLNVEMNTAGQWAHALWQGYIKRLAINVPDLDTLQLKKATTLRIGKQSFDLAPLCLSSSQQTLCLNAKKTTKLWQFALSMKHFALATLNPLLGGKLTLQGNANGTLSASYDQDSDHYQADTALTLDKSTLTAIHNYQKFPLSIDQAALTAKLSPKSTQATLKLTAPNQQLLQLELSLPHYQGKGLPQANNKMQGSLQLNINDMRFLPLISPYITQATGTLQGNTKIGGTLNKPSFDGQLTLNNAHYTLADLGISPTLNLSASAAKTSHITLQGDLTSKQQVLKLNGTIDAADHAKTTLTASGDKLELINTKEYVLTASPQLNLSLAWPNLKIKGNITIPYAKISPQDFSSTVTLPDNISYTDDNDVPIQEYKTLLKTSMHIKLKAEDININYHGIKAKAQGKLQLATTANKPLHAQGKFTVSEGSYRAYGQNLDIEPTSTILFSGPVDNPELNLSAIRTITGDLTQSNIPSYQRGLIVGLKVTGSIDTPQLNFFSRPAGLTQQDILSYLVFGLSQEQLSNSDTAVIWQVVNSIGPDGSPTILGQFQNTVQKTLGLSQLGLSETTEYNPETQEVETGTSLVMEKRLGKKLTLSYSVGLMIPVNILYLRYQLSQHFATQIDSSTLGSGFDFLYGFSVD